MNSDDDMEDPNNLDIPDPDNLHFEPVRSSAAKSSFEPRQSSSQEVSYLGSCNEMNPNEVWDREEKIRVNEICKNYLEDNQVATKLFLQTPEYEWLKQINFDLTPFNSTESLVSFLMNHSEPEMRLLGEKIRDGSAKMPMSESSINKSVEVSIDTSKNDLKAIAKMPLSEQLQAIKRN